MRPETAVQVENNTQQWRGGKGRDAESWTFGVRKGRDLEEAEFSEWDSGRRTSWGGKTLPCSGVSARPGCW